jgi:cytochrome bd-type quinol oxidase subunit 2
MITKIYLMIALAISLITISVSPLAHAACGTNVSAKEAIQCGAGEASNNKEDPAKANQRANTTITNLLNLLSAIIGVVAVIVLIIGGFRYIVSGGDENGAKSARNTIVYALVGLVIVALAQIIVKFVLNNVG